MATTRSKSRRDAIRRAADELLNARACNNSLIRTVGLLARIPVLQRLASALAAPVMGMDEALSAASRLMEQLRDDTPTTAGLRYA